MKKFNLKKSRLRLKRFLNKLKQKIWILPVVLMTTSSFSRCFATSISTAEVSQATENVKNAIIKLAMPIGGILVFTSIVIISLKMIVNANNANKRSESIRKSGMGCSRNTSSWIIISCFWYYSINFNKW